MSDPHDHDRASEAGAASIAGADASDRAWAEPASAYHPLRIARVVRETDDASSFVLEVPEPLRDTFAYRAGQFLTFRVEVDGVPLTRCYSLASAPGVDPEPKVTVKRVPGGRVSGWMIDHLRAGDTVPTLPPAGLFVLHERRRPVVLFHGGSGITPGISIVKSALATTDRRLKLVYANRDRASVIFAAELDTLAARHPDRLELVHHLDDERGFLDAAAVRALLEGWEDADHYVCGPTPFMDVVESTLEELDTLRSRIFIERFVSPPDPDEAAAAHGAAAAAQDAGPVPERVRIQQGGETREVVYVRGRSILQTALEGGFKAPSSCQDGYCGTCMAQVVEGTVHLKRNDVFTETELRAGWILTCQALPTSGELAVNYDVYYEDDDD